jgi:hypothetical protein
VQWLASADGASLSTSSYREANAALAVRQHDRVRPCRSSVLVVYHIVGHVDGKDDVAADTVILRSVAPATPGDPAGDKPAKGNDVRGLAPDSETQTPAAADSVVEVSHWDDPVLVVRGSSRAQWKDS